MAKDAAISEDTNKRLLVQVLGEHFLLRPEVEGRTTAGHLVRIDFWAYPSPHIIRLGWDPKPFGIEVKSAGLANQLKKTAIALIGQAIIYRLSTFPTRGGMVQPDFVLVYPGIGSLLALPQGKMIRGESFDDGVKYGLERLAGRFRVGELFLNEGGTAFETRFNGGRQFDTIRGKSASDPLGREHPHASR